MIKFDHYIENSKEIVFHTHQGFGDIIVCSSIANYLTKEFDSKKILFPVKKSQEKNAKRFFISNEKIKVIPFENYSKNNVVNWAKNNSYSLIATGYEKYQYLSDLPWDYSFYEKIGLDYQIKYEHKLLSRNLDIEEKIFLDLLGNHNENSKSFAFVHDDPARGFSFTPQTNLKIVKNDINYDIIDFLCILEKAEEIHMMGSSLMCLADLAELPKNNQKAYYYTFRNNLNFHNKRKWIIV